MSHPTFPSHVTLVDVGPRDGLQNEAQPVAAADKIELVHRLQAAGLREIEVTSYVSPKWVPQMADNAQVMAGIQRQPGVRYSVLTPNIKGFEGALASQTDEVVDVGQRRQGIGSDHIGIADTIGVGTAGRVTAVMERALKHVPWAELSGHFHDTYGQALTNIYG